MLALEGEVVERVLLIVLKVLGSAVLSAVGRHAEDLVTALICRASGGCTERARGMGEQAALRLDDAARQRLARAFQNHPIRRRRRAAAEGAVSPPAGVDAAGVAAERPAG